MLFPFCLSFWGLLYSLLSPFLHFVFCCYRSRHSLDNQYLCGPCAFDSACIILPMMLMTMLAVGPCQYDPIFLLYTLYSYLWKCLNNNKYLGNWGSKLFHNVIRLLFSHVLKWVLYFISKTLFSYIWHVITCNRIKTIFDWPRTSSRIVMYLGKLFAVVI